MREVLLAQDETAAVEGQRLAAVASSPDEDEAVATVQVRLPHRAASS
jgi:hypothetical protein